MIPQSPSCGPSLEVSHLTGFLVLLCLAPVNTCTYLKSCVTPRLLLENHSCKYPHLDPSLLENLVFTCKLTCWLSILLTAKIRQLSLSILTIVHFPAGSWPHPLLHLHSSGPDPLLAVNKIYFYFILVSVSLLFTSHAFEIPTSLLSSDQGPR